MPLGAMLVWMGKISRFPLPHKELQKLMTNGRWKLTFTMELRKIEKRYVDGVEQKRDGANDSTVFKNI